MRTEKEIPAGAEFNSTQQDILSNWFPHFNAFSLSQIADRNNSSKRSTRKSVQHLVDMGLVKQLPDAPKMDNNETS
jgi:predicted transcriptional regulator